MVGVTLLKVDYCTKVVTRCTLLYLTSSVVFDPKEKENILLNNLTVIIYFTFLRKQKNYQVKRVMKEGSQTTASQ